MIILFAEDDTNDVLLLRMALRRERIDCTVEAVRDGQEAVDWLSGRGQYADRGRFPFPDMIVSDLKMPRKNGFELFEWIRSQPQFQELPFVILSSSGQERDQERARELGISNYFQKSVRFREIVDYLRDFSLKLSSMS